MEPYSGVELKLERLATQDARFSVGSPARQVGRRGLVFLFFSSRAEVPFTMGIVGSQRVPASMRHGWEFEFDRERVREENWRSHFKSVVSNTQYSNLRFCAHSRTVKGTMEALNLTMRWRRHRRV